jgi:ATP adenylyltransferase/5',5'''-P-1,P-4-tetraphosphate phosphorylase II
LSNTHLHFDTHIGRQKPESIRNREAACPFCNRKELTDIIEQRGSMILLRNKYPVLRDTFQTVLIESDDCHGELSLYPKDHLYALLSFGVDKWLEMEESGQFRSVMFFKNHGPYSGGSIHHPHMQIVGLYQHDYRQHVKESDFEGILIDRQPGVECNLSTLPRAGFFEYNVILSDRGSLPKMADYLQILTHWILNHANRNCKSYNLFFYQLEERIIVKVVPRFVTSPLYVGYSLPQVASNLDEVVAEIQHRYF